MSSDTAMTGNTLRSKHLVPDEINLALGKRPQIEPGIVVVDGECHEAASALTQLLKNSV